MVQRRIRRRAVAAMMMRRRMARRMRITFARMRLLLVSRDRAHAK
jgi:hypothetical protein